jgi:predicted ferric reductase
LPLDHFIDIHKTIGIIILIETLIHTVAHLVNLFNECAIYKTNYWIILFTDKESIGYPTGVIEFLLLVVILLFALPCVRSRGYFQLFYVVHLLTIPWLFIMLLHGKQFWKWLLIPGILYAVENILRFKKTRSNKFGDTYIAEAILLPSKVTHLVIRRPTKFQYNPGDYIFINIPAIAKHEWHPFSISSVPELEDHLWLHVRAVGNWTTKLNSFVRSHLETKYADESVFRMSMRSRMSRVLSETGVFQLPGGVIMNNSNSNKKVSWTNKDTLSDAIAVKSYYTSQISIDPMCTQKRKSILKNMSRDSAHYFRSTVQDPQDDTVTLTCDESTMVDGPMVTCLETCAIDASKSTDKYSNNLLGTREPACGDDNNGHGKKASLYKKASINEAIAIEMVDHQTRQNATESHKKPKEDEQKLNNLNKKHSEDNSDVLGYLKMYTKANCLTIQQLPMDEQWRLQVYIDGPYGTINSDIYNAEHVVLIAAGIGITPHASILQSLMQRFKRTTNVCPNCDHTWESNLPCTYRSKIKKVDFIWVTREQRSLEWFLSMLSQMEIDQKKNNQHFLETHLYVTSAKRQTDLKSIGLHMTLDVIYSEEDSRYIEGLKERTHYGRPNWDIVLQQLIRKQEGKITVFFCGPLSLCNVLQTKCRDYNLIFKKEIF